MNQIRTTSSQLSLIDFCANAARKALKRPARPRSEMLSFDEFMRDGSAEIPIMMIYRENEIDELLSGAGRYATIHFLSFSTETEDDDNQ